MKKIITAQYAQENNVDLDVYDDAVTLINRLNEMSSPNEARDRFVLDQNPNNTFTVVEIDDDGKQYEVLSNVNIGKVASWAEIELEERRIMENGREAYDPEFDVDPNF